MVSLVFTAGTPVSPPGSLASGSGARAQRRAAAAKVKRKAARRRAGATAAGLVAGYLLDAALGDPRRFHPVAGYGKAAAALERRIYAPDRGAGARHTAVAVGVPVLAGGGSGGGHPAATAGARRAGRGHDVGRAGRPLAAARGAGDRRLARRARPGRRPPAPAQPVRPRSVHTGRNRVGQGDGGVGRREHLRRRGGAPVLGRGGRAARARRLPGGEHARCDGRSPQRALRPIRYRGRPDRRHRQPHSQPAHRGAHRRCVTPRRRSIPAVPHGSGSATATATRVRTRGSARRPWPARWAYGWAVAMSTSDTRRTGPASAMGGRRWHSTSTGPSGSPPLSAPGRCLGGDPGADRPVVAAAGSHAPG